MNTEQNGEETTKNPDRFGEQRAMYCLVETVNLHQPIEIFWSDTLANSREMCCNRSLAWANMLKNCSDDLAKSTGGKYSGSRYNPSSSRANRLAWLRRNGYCIRRVQVKIEVESERNSGSVRV